MSSPESKALLLKIEVLKKGLLDERKKRIRRGDNKAKRGRSY